MVAYNGGPALHECVASLFAQTQPVEIIIVDNASTDGSVEPLRRFGDRLRIVSRATNGGYAAAANAGWQSATGQLIAILNQDLILSPNCLALMRDAAASQSQETLVSPKLVMKSDPDTVNAVGNEVHLSGVAWCRGLASPASSWTGIVEVTAVSGAAFMATRELLESLRGLEEGYFMYYEDVDLSLRARLHGAVCLVACDAVAAHDWQLSLSSWKFELLERNRRALWHRFWSGHPRMYPVLIQAELMAWAYAFMRGGDHIAAKARAVRKWPRLPSPDTNSTVLLDVLARNHPYRMLFPSLPLLARIGRIVDRLFALPASSTRPKPRASE